MPKAVFATCRQLTAAAEQKRKARAKGKFPKREIKMMDMYFYFSDKVVLLFDFWNVHSPAGMALSVLIITLLAVLYEAIKVGKAKILQQMMPVITPSISQEVLGEPERASIDTGSRQLTTTPKKLVPWHIAQTVLHVVQVVLGYLVMLAVMTYNTWIFLGVIVGSTIGYFLTFPLLNAR